MEDELEDKMREFRRNRASKHKPAYMVYSDIVMKAIIRKMPKTVQELYEIKGVRIDFVKAHGHAMIALLDKYRREENATEKATA